MTTRERMIQTYSALLTVSMKRHCEINAAYFGSDVRNLSGNDVKRLLGEAMGGSSSPYAAELDRMDQRGVIARFQRAVVRRVEDGESVRRNHWAKVI